MLKWVVSFGLALAMLCFSGYRLADSQEAAATPAENDAAADPAETDKTTASIKAGLAWLVRHQDDNGGWEPVAFAKRCTDQTCAGSGEQENKVSVSAMALVAFLGAGTVPDAKGDELQQAAARAVGYLVSAQDTNGAFGAKVQSHMYEHASATLALSLALSAGGGDDVKNAATKAVEYLVQAQNPYAGWRYKPKCGESDTSVTGWSVLALDAARRAGLQVPEQAFKDASAWIDSVTNQENCTVGYLQRSDAGSKIIQCGKNDWFASHPTMTALGLLIHLAAGKQVAEKDKIRFLDQLAGDLPAWRAPLEEEIPRDFTYWYLGTKAVLAGCDTVAPLRSAWGKGLVAIFLQNQRDDGCAKGSWDPACRWSFTGGRPWATAMNVATLCELKNAPAAQSQPSAAPAKKGVQERLSLTRVDLDFVDTPLADALDFIRAMYNFNIVSDVTPEKMAESRLTLKVDSLPLEEALKTMLKILQLEYAVFDEVIHVSIPANILAMKNEALLRQLSVLKISIDFDNAPLEDVLGFVQDFISVPIVMDNSVPQTTRKKLITIRMKDTSARDFLGLLMESTGCSFEVRNGSSVVVSMAASEPGGARVYRRTYSLKGIDKPVEAVLGLIEKVLGRPAATYHQETDCIVVEGNTEDHQTVIETLGTLRNGKK